MPKITAVVVTYNAMLWIDKTLSSLDGIPVVVVDNQSTDGTPQHIENEFPQVTLIRNPTNRGFGAANNAGMLYAIEHNADYVLLLNQDAWFNKGLSANWSAAFDAVDKVAITSPVHFNSSNKLDFGFEEYMPEEFLRDYGEGKMQGCYEVRFVNAAAWLVPVSILKQLGGFHPAFYHYGEDKEFVNRIKRHGFKVIVDSSLSIIHDRPQHRADNKYFTNFERMKRRFLVQTYDSATPFENFALVKSALWKSMFHSLLRGNLKRSINYYKCILFLRNSVKNFPFSSYSLKNSAHDNA